MGVFSEISIMLQEDGFVPRAKVFEEAGIEVHDEDHEEGWWKDDKDGIHYGKLEHIIPQEGGECGYEEETTEDSTT